MYKWLYFKLLVFFLKILNFYGALTGIEILSIEYEDFKVFKLLIAEILWSAKSRMKLFDKTFFINSFQPKFCQLLIINPRYLLWSVWHK